MTEPVGLSCPGCGNPPFAVMGGGTQAFCGTEDCPWFTWDPTATLREINEGAGIIDLSGDQPEARLVRETETAGCYQVWHHGQLVVPEAELAKPGPGDFRLYCRELLPGKYELGWERKP